MASYDDALAARDIAFELLFDRLNMRPIGAGLVGLGDKDYGLKVILPRTPAEEPPETVSGVPVTYFIAADRPELKGQTPSNWRQNSLARRRR